MANTSRPVFSITRNGCDARMVVVEEAALPYLVLKGSRIATSEMPNSTTPSITKSRLPVIWNEDGILQEDKAFKSPSGASSFVLGGRSSGYVEWKDENGRTLKEIQAESENKGNENRLAWTLDDPLGKDDPTKPYQALIERLNHAGLKSESNFDERKDYSNPTNTIITIFEIGNSQWPLLYMRVKGEEISFFKIFSSNTELDIERATAIENHLEYTTLKIINKNEIRLTLKITIDFVLVSMTKTSMFLEVLTSYSNNIDQEFVTFANLYHSNSECKGT